MRGGVGTEQKVIRSGKESLAFVRTACIAFFCVIFSADLLDALSFFLLLLLRRQRGEKESNSEVGGDNLAFVFCYFFLFFFTIIIFFFFFGLSPPFEKEKS